MRIRDWSSDVCSSDLAPQKPDRAERTPPKREASPPAKKPSPAKSTGSDSRSTRDRPRGSRLGDDFLKGITDQASDSKSQTPRPSTVSPQVLAGPEAAIRPHIQPCADRQDTGRAASREREG